MAKDRSTNGKKNRKPPQLLTEQDAQKIILAAGAYRYPDGLTDPEMMQVLKWAEDARWGALILDQLLDGELLIGAGDGDVMLADPKVHLSPGALAQFRKDFLAIVAGKPRRCFGPQQPG